MNRKNILILFISVVLVIGVVAVITAAAIPSMEEAADAAAEAESGQAEEKESVKGELPAAAGKEAAEALVGETLSREEVQKNLGEWEKFEMSSNGCERGVYAGRFYYEDFVIFSRTYDKGKTFHIVSIN